MARRGNVTIIGRAALEARIAELPRAIDRGARQAIKEETAEVAEDMRAFAPELTGNLKSKIRVDLNLSQFEGFAVSGAPYTKYVVNGTSENQAQDFMTPAAELSRGRFRRRLIDEINAQLRGITG